MNRRTWIKICGITRAPDLAAAVDAGVDAVGFVFAESPRRVTPDAVRRMVLDLPPHVLRVGVFVDENPSEIARIVAFLKTLSGEYNGKPL